MNILRKINLELVGDKYEGKVIWGFMIVGGRVF